MKSKEESAWLGDLTKLIQEITVGPRIQPLVDCLRSPHFTMLPASIMHLYHHVVGIC